MLIINIMACSLLCD